LDVLFIAYAYVFKSFGVNGNAQEKNK